MKRRISALFTDPVYRAMYALALPIIVQNLFSAMVNSADVVMLNYVGQSSLAAVSLAVQYSNIIYMIFYGLGTGASILCAQYWGKQDTAAIQKILGIALRFSLGTGLGLFLLAFLIPEPMMRIFTNDEELIRIGIGYLRIVSFSFLFWSMSEIYLAVLRSMERVRISTALSVSALLMNIFLNAVFIFGLFGAPKMGAAGVALATSISRGIQLVCCLAVSSVSPDVRLKITGIFEKAGVLMQDFLKLAIPATLNDVSWSTAFSMYLVIMGHLSTDLVQTGTFECSDKRVNRLQQNIQWGARSNFVDIPTDCPQRDERMGWTGDIAVFGQTACFNFDMARFLDKWLADMRSEQNRGGGIPNTVPVHLYGFPATMPRMAIDWWGDACVMVPWALYQATGEKRYLEENYEMMKKYVKACRFWAGFGVGEYRYIWHTPATFHFGDWVAPDVPKMQQWQARSKWTATASLYHTSSMTGKIARILGHADEAAKYEKLAENVSKAYIHVFTDGQGRLKNEFQTGYVLPLQFHMFPDGVQEKAAENLTALVKKNNWCIGTGFPGTPYILFALADNGQKDAAYQMLMNTRCPSWLYEVKVGATTIWERWDGLDENGQCPIGDDGTDKMISYNHYASGAVGDFLYRRVAGLEPLEPGYRRFRVKPIPGGGLTQACAWTETPYGRVQAEWEIKDHQMTVKVTVPVGAEGELILPDGRQVALQSGVHTQTCPAE